MSKNYWAHVIRGNNNFEYVTLISTESISKLAEEKRSYAWLQRGSATAHTANDILAALGELLATE
jgi:hypothetical protein